MGMHLATQLLSGLKSFGEKIAIEARETKEAGRILTKYGKGEEITEDEEKALKEQLCDILKMAGIGIPFALIPGASVLLPVLIAIAEKKDIHILPSAFNEKIEKQEKQESE